MELQVVDLSRYLESSSSEGEPRNDVLESCREVSRILRESGALLVKDPRCSEEDNDQFIDMMETFFQMPHDFKRSQGRPDLHYYVGITPEGVEVPRILVDEEMQKRVEAMPEEYKPHSPKGPDHKWRYIWRFQEEHKPVIPQGFPEWRDVMDTWGYKMISAVEVVAEMAAIGFGIPKDTFTSLMNQGPHLLAPTGNDLNCYNEEGTIFAGYHYDLSFLTIHGRSRFPGLYIWLRNGKKVLVQVPRGFLLVQTGKQMEWLTGGECIAGMHEVVVTSKTIDAINLAKEQNRSLWRVSSTLFTHIASDAELKPLGKFAESPLASNYPSMPAGEFVEQELSIINLK